MESSTPRPSVEAPTLRIVDRGDLVAAVPYLLGFHPQDSLVVLVLDGKRLIVTARIDLPSAEEFDQVPELVRRMITANDGDVAVLIAFLGDPADPIGWLLAGCCDDLGTLVRDAMIVTEGRWLSLFDGAEDTCDVAAPSAAAAVMQGMVALGSRADVGQLALPADDADPRHHTAALLRLARDHPTDRARYERMLWLLDAADPSGAREGPPDSAASGEPAADGGPATDPKRPPALEPDHAAELAVLAGTAAGRAATMAGLDRERAASAVALWSAVVRLTPAHWAVGALCLLGVSAWIDGDGALQLICAERALALDPDDLLAEDLLDLNSAMVPPSAWDPGGVGRRHVGIPPDAIRHPSRVDGIGA